VADPTSIEITDTLNMTWMSAFSSGPVPGGPSVVAIGGGHGLAAALQAARRYAGQVTAIVSVADDGGSSGRLRRSLDVAPPGDLRKAIGALAAEGSIWPGVLEHRFDGGELHGHTVGNIMLVGLVDALGSISAACAEAARIVNAVGSVFPATTEAVTLRAEIGGADVDGQVAIQQSAPKGRVRDVRVVPEDAPASAGALGAIMEADQVLIGPGSLFTSLVAASVVPEIRTAIALSPARVIQIANLAAEEPETTGLDGTDHLLAVLEHQVRVDTLLYDRQAALAVNEGYVFEHGVMPVGADLGAVDGPRHDPDRLAKALADLL
jgi:uncharacterized cofD-like protein